MRSQTRPTILRRARKSGTARSGFRICLLVLLSVSVVNIGGAPAQTANPGANFVDVTDARGLHFRHISPHTSKKYLLETMGSGVGLLDYDNDGRLDVFFANGALLSDPMLHGAVPSKTAPEHFNRLFHQKADGTFEDVTQKSGLQGIGFSMGVAVGDFDNDGYEDLYVTGYGRNQLYHNNGNGTFTDITDSAGVGGSGWSTSAAWVDLDNDGLLDLVVLRYLQWDFDDLWCGEHKEGFRAYCHPDTYKAIAPLVFHNEGHGHFSDYSRQSGISLPGKGLGIAIADYDRDGRIDIAIANDSMPEFLYRNKGNGKFEETGLTSQMAVDEDGRTYAGMGIDLADFNNDGLPDLVIDNLANQVYALYGNDGGGMFTYVSKPAGLGKMTLLHSGWGLRFFDFDNDGWKDLLVAQGHDLDTIELTSPQLHYREAMLLARNIRGRFTDVTSSAGPVFQERFAGRGLATGDIDNDGRIDAVITTNDGAAHILHNETSTSNHWISFTLIGHQSNRDGIGAEIRLVTLEGLQCATVTTASSYLSSSDKRVHFGLGTESSVSTVEIHWPSGILQILHNIQADRSLTVDEPSVRQK